ncbi:MAG: hypothetical protein SGCHY_003065 [Lobulomycetales sp.]
MDSAKASAARGLGYKPTIPLNAASGIALKATLSQAQSAFKKVTDGKKYPLKRKKPLSVGPANHSDDEPSDLVNQQLQASWISLQRKEKEYEQLKHNLSDTDSEDNDNDNDNKSQNFLKKHDNDDKKSKNVDFLKKHDNDSGARLVDFLKKHEPGGELDDSDLIETTDELGRTRLMKRQDAKRMGLLPSEQKKTQEPSSAAADFFPITFVKSRGNEEEAQKPENVHYDTSKEIRTMGVGHYKFSQDEETRAAQLSKIKNLRQETLDNRERVQKARQGKKSALDRRRELLQRKAEEIQAKKKAATLDYNGKRANTSLQSHQEGNESATGKGNDQDSASDFLSTLF